MAYLEDPDALNNLVRRLNTNSNVQFIIDGDKLPADLDEATWVNQIETALKKMAVYADKVIFLCGNVKTQHALGNTNLYRTRVAALAENAKLQKEFNSIFYFVPTTVAEESFINDYWDDGTGDGQWEESTLKFRFDGAYHNAHGYPVQLNDPRLRQHFLEQDKSADYDTVLNVWLPQVKNVPFDTFLKVRRDNGESFQKLQAAIKTFLQDSKAETTETKLKELFEFLHYEIIRYNDHMEKIRKTRALRTTQMVVSTTIVGLAFAINSTAMQTITSFLGLYQGKDYIDFLIKQKENIHDLETSDFYLPWLINQQNFKSQKLISWGRKH